MNQRMVLLCAAVTSFFTLSSLALFPPQSASTPCDLSIAADRFDIRLDSLYGPLAQERLDDFVKNFGPEQRLKYIQQFSLGEIAAEFPITAGMTIGEMDMAIAVNEELVKSTEIERLKTVYNLGWEKRVIKEGHGFVYFWVNLKHLFHVGIVIESGAVRSVWVMPGNSEWVSGIYYGISGVGSYEGESIQF